MVLIEFGSFNKSGLYSIDHDRSAQRPKIYGMFAGSTKPLLRPAVVDRFVRMFNGRYKTTKLYINMSL